MSDEKKPQNIQATLARELAEFPDGGRATLVRRYSPALTKRELDILASCPYEALNILSGATALRLARELVRRKLLEQDPTSKASFRVTSAGADVVHIWKSAGWLA